MKQRISAAAAGLAAGLAGTAGVAAQTRIQDRFFGGGESTPEDVVSAGNGGVATSSASGGAISAGDINSGGNAGNAVGVGDTYGSVGVDGGDVANLTDLGLTSNGGTAISDASGGDYNLAFVS
jgi:hypothetical protein